MNLQLENKPTLVTGSSRGICEAIAKTFAAEGASVVVHGRDETNARRVADEITRPGGRAAIAIAISPATPGQSASPMLLLPRSVTLTIQGRCSPGWE